MVFTVITSIDHHHRQTEYFAYRPYSSEIDIWAKNIDTMIVVAPCQKNSIDPIDAPYRHKKIIFKAVKSFDVKGMANTLQTVIHLPKIIRTIFVAMHAADHIHLRCPGNMGLLGCLLQIFFPHKKKSAKYAGNWDPSSGQPWSYRLQQWILSNTFLTRNMQVLVYGQWPKQSKNIKPFFTATYSETEKKDIALRDLAGTIQLLFVGTLSSGKQPLYAVQLAEKLSQDGFQVQMKFFGSGSEQQSIENYIRQHDLIHIVTLMGNHSKEAVAEAYQQSHFLILPSLSEGWPKVVAEAMFWGCVPISTAVSCVPYMLDNGNRGLLLEGDLNCDAAGLELLIGDEDRYRQLSVQASDWSRQFTTEKFEAEIQKLLQQ